MSEQEPTQTTLARRCGRCGQGIHGHRFVSGDGAAYLCGNHGDHTPRKPRRPPKSVRAALRHIDGASG